MRTLEWENIQVRAFNRPEASHLYLHKIKDGGKIEKKICNVDALE